MATEAFTLNLTELPSGVIERKPELPGADAATPSTGRNSATTVALPIQFIYVLLFEFTTFIEIRCCRSLHGSGARQYRKYGDAAP